MTGRTYKICLHVHAALAVRRRRSWKRSLDMSLSFRGSTALGMLFSALPCVLAALSRSPLPLVLRLLPCARKRAAATGWEVEHACSQLAFFGASLGSPSMPGARSGEALSDKKRNRANLLAASARLRQRAACSSIESLSR